MTLLSLTKDKKLNASDVMEIALRQIDYLGFELQRRGISSKVNRHQLAALAATKQQHMLGELARYQLKLDIQRMKLEKAAQQASDQADEFIAKLPNAVSKPIHRIKHQLTPSMLSSASA